MANIFKKIINAFRKTAKAEIEEIKQLEITDQDKEEAMKLTALARAGMLAAGVPCPAIACAVLQRVLAYGIRDLKDGVEIREKLIINRLMAELEETI